MSERCDLIHVGFEFERHERNPGGDAAKAVLAVLQLQHTEPDDEGHLAPAPFHHPWGPREDAGPDVIAVWEELLGVVESRAVRARLHDLLWVERAGEQPFQHARAAVEDYVAAAELGACDGLYQALTLMRALDLAREVNAQDLFGSVSGGAVRALEAEVEGDEVPERPGVSLRLLRLLADLPESDRQVDLTSRLEEMHTLLEGSHPHVRESVFRIQEKLAHGDPEETRSLQRSNVHVWIDWALEQEGGVFRRGALGMALERANTIADADDLRETIRLRMQEIGDDDLGLQETAVDHEYTGGGDRRTRSSPSSATTGSRAPLCVSVHGVRPREIHKRTPKPWTRRWTNSSTRDLSRWPSSMIRGAPSGKSVTDDEKREAALQRRENFSAGFHGSLATLVPRANGRAVPSNAGRSRGSVRNRLHRITPGRCLPARIRSLLGRAVRRGHPHRAAANRGRAPPDARGRRRDLVHRTAWRTSRARQDARDGSQRTEGCAAWK